MVRQRSETRRAEAHKSILCDMHLVSTLQARYPARVSFAVLLVALVATQAGVQSAHWTDDEVAVAALFADMVEAFRVETVEEISRGGRVYRFRSSQPIDQTSDGRLYARASLRVESRSGAEQAAAEIRRRLADADPDTGISYAWDFLTSAENRVLHLHAECTLPPDSFHQLMNRLTARTEAAANPGPSISCRCGGGCEGLAAGGAPDEVPDHPLQSVPLVEHLEGEVDDYDNRLDPSGTWTNPEGSLSLMHAANRLSFSYLSVFGNRAHICEAAGVAGLVGRDRYEHVDDQGVVAIVVKERQIRLELVDGIASFCGAGWSGDTFTINDFERPMSCEVTADRVFFHVVDHIDPERRPSRAVRGDRVDAVPAQHLGEPTMTLARLPDRNGAIVGLLRSDAMRCSQSRR